VPGHRVGPETDRLVLRALTIDDAEDFFALNSNPEVMRFTGEPRLTSVKEARDAIARYPDFDTVGYGRWACELKSEQRVIGFCGLKYLADFAVVDLGYRFLPDYWGRGLATEACEASIRYGFDVLDLELIVGFVMHDNPASVRVLEKVGMRLDGDVDYDGLSVLRYSIERPAAIGRDR
jgi:RimJ/RimL family protein N-acetyltransferase